MLSAAGQPTQPVRPLPPEICAQMETLFRTSFAGVTYGAGPEPSSIGARAFTRGTHLSFAPGAFAPHSRGGIQLLAHELCHVVQQRSRRLRERFGLAGGVVYEESLEQDADWMGEQAARFCQPVFGATASTGAAGLRLSRPFEVVPGSYQVAAGMDGRFAGAVMVHERDRSAIDITDLKVLPEFRKRGLGRMLVLSALETGLHLGRRYAILVARDSGTSRLTRWYQRLGFQNCGFRLGYPELAASAARALAGVEAFTAPPLSGLCIQCMDDDERRRMRAQRFKKELDQQGLDDEKKKSDIDHLRACVSAMREAILREGSIKVIAIGAAYKHHYPNPVQTFCNAIGSAPWTQVEADLIGCAELIVTVRLLNGHTVAASYKRYGDTATVFHCGETSTGVGYGTLLHY